MRILSLKSIVISVLFLLTIIICGGQISKIYAQNPLAGENEGEGAKKEVKKGPNPLAGENEGEGATTPAAGSNNNPEPAVTRSDTPVTSGGAGGGGGPRYRDTTPTRVAPAPKVYIPAKNVVEGAPCQIVGSNNSCAGILECIKNDASSNVCAYSATNPGERCTPGATKCPDTTSCSQVSEGWYCVNEYTAGLSGPAPDLDEEANALRPEAITVWTPEDSGAVAGVNYNPILGDKAGVEFTTSDMCIYSQLDEEGTGCGTGLFIDNACQFDSRISQSLTKVDGNSCAYTDICYVKAGDVCSVGLCKGGDCTSGSIGNKDCSSTEPGFGQPIDCEVAKGKPAPGFLPPFDVSNRKSGDITKCVYTHPENDSNPETAGKCFVGMCEFNSTTPGNAATDEFGRCLEGKGNDWFNTSCQFEPGVEGLGQQVQCPGAAEEAGFTGLTNLIEISVNRKSDNMTFPFKLAVDPMEFVDGSQEVTFDLTQIPELINNDEIQFCIAIPSSLVGYATGACTGFFKYQVPN